MADINSLIALGGGGLQKFDLASLATPMVDLEAKRLANATAGFGLQQGYQRQSALSNYDQQQRAGNPNAINELNTQPQEMGQIVHARAAMDVDQRAKFDWVMGHRAKAAWSVAQHPANSPERLEAWNGQLSELLANQAINQEQYKQLYGKQPSDLVLKQYIDAGRAVPTWAQEQGQAGAKRLSGAAVAALTDTPPAAAAPAPSSNEKRLIRSESGGDPGLVNQLGYAGTYQFGAPRLADLGVYKPGADENMRSWSRTYKTAPGKWTGEFNIPGFPEVKTVADFLNKPEAQKAAYGIHREEMGREIKSNGFEKYIGTRVGGVLITRDGLENMLHLGGVGSTRRALESDGRDNKTDANGTSVLSYARMASAGGLPSRESAPAPAAAAPGPAPGPGAAPGLGAAPSAAVAAPALDAAPVASPAALPADATPDAKTPDAKTPDAKTPDAKAAFSMPVSVPMPGNPRLEKLLPEAMIALATEGLPEGTKKLAEIVVTQAMKAQELTPDERQYVVDMKQRAFLKDPALPFMPLGDWLKDQSAKKATNVSQTVEAAGGKKLAEALSKRYIEAQKEGLESSSTVRLYETMDKMLDDPNIYTGTGGNQIAQLKKLGTTLLGLNLKGVANSEVAQKITDELALSFKKESADPNTSNFERQIYERMATGLTDSAAGRKLVIAMRVGDLAYKAEVAKAWRGHLKENGDVDPKVDDALVRLAEKRREKLGDFLDQANEIASATVQPSPTAGIDQKYIDELFKRFNLPGKK